MRTAAIIVAGGRGERAGGELPKQYRTLMGVPVISWSVLAMTGEVDEIVVVCAPEHDAVCRTALEGYAYDAIVHGGATRTASVRTGLAAVKADAEIILIHDAARPGLSPRTVGELKAKVEAGAAAVAPALAVPDALTRTDTNGRIIADVDRAFRADVIRAAYAALPGDATMADDLAVARAHGAEALLIPGEQKLMKITYAEDLDMAERLMQSRTVTCVGHGVDAHRFGEGDFVTLCGVRISHNKGLIGHSDADAGWHALVDAILGAIGEGDIGAHFPPNDPKWKDANSETFLRHAVQLAKANGGEIVHVDITLICERPKVGPHREAMRARTAEVLGLPLQRVSVKATTTEGMGFLGREEGLAAQATASVEMRR
jgi:2-C-methyl-D-erythritol 4-phosphate cytidylyltransferase / 2-C-methyl-D-erythritol 2,4-cyclodiphosphate synthase